MRLLGLALTDENGDDESYNAEYLEPTGNKPSPGVNLINTKNQCLNAQVLVFKCQMPVFSISTFIIQVLVFKTLKTVFFFKCGPS